MNEEDHYLKYKLIFVDKQEAMEAAKTLRKGKQKIKLLRLGNQIYFDSFESKEAAKIILITYGMNGLRGQ